MAVGDFTISGVPDELRAAVENAAHAERKSVDEIAHYSPATRYGPARA
jgi:hypothetical protein